MKFFTIMLSTFLLGGCMGLTSYVRSDIPFVTEVVAKATMPPCENAAYEARSARARMTRHNTMRTEARQTCVYR